LNGQDSRSTRTAHAFWLHSVSSPWSGMCACSTSSLGRAGQPTSSRREGTRRD